MALLNDLKKILFGAKAVTKSSADKAFEASKEAGQELAESGSEMMEKAKDKVEQVGKVVIDKADQVMDKAGDLAEDIGSSILKATETLKTKAEEIMGGKEDAEPIQPPSKGEDIMDEIIASTQMAPTTTHGEALELTPLENAPEQEDVFDVLKKNTPTEPPIPVTPADSFQSGSSLSEQTDKPQSTGTENMLDKAADFTENLGKKVMEKGSDLAGKFGEAAEGVGESIFEKGGEAIEKAKDMASDIGSKILKAKEELMAKAEAEAAKSGENADSLIDKMKNLNQKLEDKISGNNQQFADKPLDTGGSEFSKHDSFWEKADRFAKGDYHMKGKEPKPGELTIKENPDYKAPDKGKVKGFDDNDGDGDELIDDAIIES